VSLLIMWTLHEFHFLHNESLRSVLYNKFSTYKIWGYHGCDYEECRLLEYCAVWLL
jgi:hypothetical protein